jgi:hypothetical protein
MIARRSKTPGANDGRAAKSRSSAVLRCSVSAQAGLGDRIRTFIRSLLCPGTASLLDMARGIRGFKEMATQPPGGQR